MYVYVEKDEEKDTERKRVFLKKRERTTHQPPQKTKTRASSRFLFFRRVGGAKGAFGTNNTNLRTNRVGI